MHVRHPPQPHSVESGRSDLDLSVEGHSLARRSYERMTDTWDWEDYMLPSGLRRSEAFGLMMRELTAEDYDTLLQLDDTIAKKVVGLAEVDKLTILKSNHDEGKCGVCLNSFQPGDPLKELPCHHRFHVACIDKWLLTYSNICPIDGLPIT